MSQLLLEGVTEEDIAELIRTAQRDLAGKILTATENQHRAGHVTGPEK
jgi:hypothetical protein